MSRKLGVAEKPVHSQDDDEVEGEQTPKRRPRRRQTSHVRFKIPKWIHDPELDDELARIDNELTREGR